MDGGFLFENDVYVQKCNNFGTAVAAADRLPASGSFIDMDQYDHGVFLIGIGAIDTATTLAVYEDTAATETADIQAISGVSQALAGDEDNKFLTIEFNVNQMDRTDGYRYVTLVSSGGAGSNDYLSVWFLGFKARKRPVTKHSDHVYHVSDVT